MKTETQLLQKGGPQPGSSREHLVHMFRYNGVCSEGLPAIRYPLGLRSNRDPLKHFLSSQNTRRRGDRRNEGVEYTALASFYKLNPSGWRRSGHILSDVALLRRM